MVRLTKPTQKKKMNEFLAAIPIALLIVISTGPVFFVVIETSISKGARRAFSVDLGAVLADCLFIFIGFLGANTLREHLQGNPTWFILGGSLLLFYGLSALFLTYKKKNKIVFHSEQLSKGNYLFYIAKGFLLNGINMGSFLFWTGLTVVFGTKYEMDQTRLFTFFTYIILVYLGFELVKIYLAKQLKNVLTPQVIYKLKQFVHVFIMFFGLFIVFQGIFPEQKTALQEKWEQNWK